MSKLLSLAQRAPKTTSITLAIMAAAVIIPATLFAWGPERTPYTMEAPAKIVTFNSITNNPDFGDERNFVTIKDAADTTTGGWVDDITVQNGKEYYVRMYVHNDADENLNLVAQNVTAKFNIPNYGAKRIQIDGYVSSTNASPTESWDQAVFNGGTADFNIDYVTGSATYTNNVFASGTPLGDTVVSTGAQLGYDSLNGNIPGCLKYSGVVTFKVKATVAFDVQKTVRVDGSTDKTFKENVTVNPGDKVNYQIRFKNTGKTQLNQVAVQDILPAGIKYVAGTSTITDTTGTKTINDGITDGGYVSGNYVPDSESYIRFTGQVAPNSELAVCGVNVLTNTAKVTTDKGSLNDTAVVNVTKTCTTPVVPVTPVAPVTPVTPTTPKQLPTTGAGDDIASILGLGSMITSAGYYLASRRSILGK